MIILPSQIINSTIISSQLQIPWILYIQKLDSWNYNLAL